MYRILFNKFFDLQGWTLKGQHMAAHRRSVVIAAPHTSNWDLVYTLVAFDRLNLPVRFTVKDSWMKFPQGIMMRHLGGIGIDRSPREGSTDRISMVDAMVRLFEDSDDDLAITITPEGTRSLRHRWKSGFYHVARGAGVPILLGYLDYGKREAGVGKVIEPSGDYEADMREIAAFYQGIEAKYPEKFSVDQRFINSP